MYVEELSLEVDNKGGDLRSPVFGRTAKGIEVANVAPLEVLRASTLVFGGRLQMVQRVMPIWNWSRIIEMRHYKLSDKLIWQLK